MNRPIFAIAAGIIIMMVSHPALAYRLPACQISDQEREEPAEDVLLRYRMERENIAQSVSTARLNDHRQNPKIRLTARERKFAKKYNALLEKIVFWEHTVNLKNSLASLHGEKPPVSAVSEADLMAKKVIETLYELSQKWRIGSSALFNNFLVNIGAKEKGFCYHYVANLRRALLGQDWKYFEIRWGTAWENTFRENNALVITAKDTSFEAGIAVDAWRTAGRPFWTPVKGDRFPWIEAFNIEENFDVE